MYIALSLGLSLLREPLASPGGFGLCRPVQEPGFLHNKTLCNLIVLFNNRWTWEVQRPLYHTSKTLILMSSFLYEPCKNTYGIIWLFSQIDIYRITVLYLHMAVVSQTPCGTNLLPDLATSQRRPHSLITLTTAPHTTAAITSAIHSASHPPSCPFYRNDLKYRTRLEYHVRDLIATSNDIQTVLAILFFAWVER